MVNIFLKNNSHHLRLLTCIPICLFIVLKLRLVYLVHCWNFSHTFFKKNQNKKVNNGTLQEREQAKIVDVRKRNSKLSGKISSIELSQFAVILSQL